MGRLSLETNSKVIVMWGNGYPVSKIRERLSQEGVSISRVSLFALIKKFKNTRLVIDLKRKPRPCLLGECHYCFIDETMAANNELISRQLFLLFMVEYPEIQIFISMAK